MIPSCSRASPAVASSNGKIYAIGGDQISEVNFYRARYVGKGMLQHWLYSRMVSDILIPNFIYWKYFYKA